MNLDYWNPQVRVNCITRCCALNCGPPKIHMLKSQSPLSQNGTILGDKVFKVLIKLKEAIRVGPLSNMTVAFIERGRGTRGACTQKAGCPGKAAAREWPPASQGEKLTRQHLDLRLPATRTARKGISVVEAMRAVVFVMVAQAD